MSTVGFALKNLKRRGFQTSLTIVAMSLCVSATVSTVLIANNLDLSIPIIMAGRLSGSFVNVFSGFASVVTLLSFLSGAVMAYFFVSASMSDRTRDIGVIKAIGCLTDQVFGYFATQLFLMVLTSCIIGASVGVLLFYLFTALNRSFLSSLQVPINPWTIILVLIVFAIIAHLFGIMPVVRAIRVRPSDALFPSYLRGVSFKSARIPIGSLGFSVKVAYRAFMRRRFETFSTIICLSIVLSTATLVAAGTAIANHTTQSYFMRGVGQNVIIVGHPSIVGQYMFFLDRYFRNEEKATLNYSDSKFAISDLTVSELSSIRGVVKADARLFLEATVFERPAFFIVDMQYVTVGDQRSADAVVFGVDSERMINDWHISGRILNNTDEYSVMLGDSLASNILSSPFDQKATILEKNFNIVSVALDPLNLGFVAYLPLRTMHEVLNQTGYNLLLLKVDPALRLQVLEEIGSILSGTELQFVELNPSIEKYSSFLNSVWSSFTLLSIFFLATAALCLFNHMTFRILEQEPEFGIIRALGAKPRKIVKIILLHASLIVLISGAIGFSIGLLVSFTFLIPEAAISITDLLLVMAWPLFTVGFLCVTSLYPALKIAKKPIFNLMYRL